MLSSGTVTMGMSAHSQHVLRQLAAQLEFGFLCDVIVSIGDVHFRAHRAVLAACSTYFHKLFVSQPAMASRAHTSYTLSPELVRPEHFDLILQMMYHGLPEPPPPANDSAGLRTSMAFLEFYTLPPLQGEGSAQTGKSCLQYGVEVCEQPQEEEGEGGEREAGVGLLGGQSSNCFLYSPDGVVEANVRSRMTEQALQGEVDREQGKDSSFSSSSSSSSSSSTSSSSSSSSSSLPSSPLSASPSPQPNSWAQRLKPTSSSGPVKSEPPDSPSFLELHGIKVVQVVPVAHQQTSTTSTVEEGEVTGPIVSIQNGFLQTQPMLIKPDPHGSSSPILGQKAGVGGGGGRAGSGGEPLQPPTAKCMQWAWMGKSVLLSTQPGSSPPASLPHKPRSSASQKPKPILLTLNKKPDTPAPPPFFPCTRCELSFDTSCALEEHLVGCGRKRPVRHRKVPQWLQRSPSHLPPASPSPAPVSPSSVEVELEDPSVVVSWPPVGHQCCKTCGKFFKRAKMLQLHRPRCPGAVPLSRARSEARNHVCNVCGKAFLQRGHLMEHEATHSHIKRFSCQSCDKQFVRRRELKVHEARHVGQATYHCQFCGHASYRKNGHYHHLTTHITKPKVICQGCFHICENPAQLKEHEMEHRHMCEHCGAKFRLKKELARHFASCESITEGYDA